MITRLLVIAVIILSLGIAGIIGCITAEPSSSPSQQAVDIPDTQQLPEPPKVFEKDVETVWSSVWFGIPQEVLTQIIEGGTLRFELEAGNRVEGEVTTWQYNEDGSTTPAQGRVKVFAFVRDPNKNIVLENSAPGATLPDLSGIHTTQTYPAQAYPWRFSFIAATTGEFSLEVNTGRWETFPTYGAHLKVTVYEK